MLLDDIERSVVELLAQQTILRNEILDQLRVLHVVTRTHDEEARFTAVELREARARIIPSGCTVADYVDIAGLGSVLAELEIREGRLYSLTIEASAKHWPRHPVLLGIGSNPEPDLDKVNDDNDALDPEMTAAFNAGSVATAF